MVIDYDLPTYLNKAQSIIEEIKFILQANTLPKILDKLNNLFMASVFTQSSQGI